MTPPALPAPLPAPADGGFMAINKLNEEMQRAIMQNMEANQAIRASQQANSAMQAESALQTNADMLTCIAAIFTPDAADHAAMVKRLEDRYLFTGTFKPAQK